MVSWYKHDIAAWMDGTEALSDGAYRAYHVICQLIYLNGGPIALNERGIAGRCNQSLQGFKKHLKKLLDAKKLTLDDGRLSNTRATLELEEIGLKNFNANKRNETSGKSKKSARKPLENNDPSAATPTADKIREDKNRADQSDSAGELHKEIVKAFEAANSPSIPDTSRVELWLSQGYDVAIILATVRDGLARKPSIHSLKYFDAALQDAHAKRLSSPLSPSEINWDLAVTTYIATGNWPRWAPGVEPEMAGCRVPAEILAKHGFGEKLQGPTR